MPKAERQRIRQRIVRESRRSRRRSSRGGGRMAAIGPVQTLEAKWATTGPGPDKILTFFPRPDLDLSRGLGALEAGVLAPVHVVGTHNSLSNMLVSTHLRPALLLRVTRGLASVSCDDPSVPSLPVLSIPDSDKGASPLPELEVQSPSRDSYSGLCSSARHESCKHERVSCFACADRCGRERTRHVCQQRRRCGHRQSMHVQFQ